MPKIWLFIINSLLICTAIAYEGLEKKEWVFKAQNLSMISGVMKTTIEGHKTLRDDQEEKKKIIITTQIPLSLRDGVEFPQTYQIELKKIDGNVETQQKLLQDMVSKATKTWIKAKKDKQDLKLVMQYDSQNDVYRSIEAIAIDSKVDTQK